MLQVLYSHDQLYKHIIHNHNDNTLKTTSTVLLEKYTSHFIWKGCMWEGVGDRTQLQHIDSHSIGHNRISFPFSWAAQPGAWGPTLLGAGFLYRMLSTTGLVSKTNWLPVFTELYNSSTPTFFLWASQIALIQPIHGQDYTLLFLDRTHLLFTQVHFLFWQPGRVIGQYTTQALCWEILQ